MLKKKRWIWVASIVGVLAIIAIAGFFVRGTATPAGTEVEEHITVQKVAEQELSETILVTGKIVPESEQKVFLEPDKGEIREFQVEENQPVKEGDPLFIYDSAKLQSELNKAVRERDLIRKRSNVEINQIAEINKQIKAGAAQTAEDGLVIDVNELKKQKTDLEIQNESTKSEITSAQELINELDKQIKEMTAVSKIDGIVVKVDKNPVSSESGSNEPVVHITSSEPFKVIGSMSEFDAVKIKEEQAVIVRPKVYKEREWKGIVESVSHFPNEEGGGEDFGGGGNVTMYPFKVAIKDDTSELRQGFHVSLEIKIDAEEKSLVVPHTAIIDEEGTDIVYVLTDGILERREVQTGSMNDEFIELKDGVTKGELVVISPHDGMHDGMEVNSFDEIE